MNTISEIRNSLVIIAEYMSMLAQIDPTTNENTIDDAASRADILRFTHEAAKLTKELLTIPLLATGKTEWRPPVYVDGAEWWTSLCRVCRFMAMIDITDIYNNRKTPRFCTQCGSSNVFNMIWNKIPKEPGRPPNQVTIRVRPLD